MTMQKLVSGIRLFTLSPRFTRLRSLREPPAQEVLRSFSDAARASRFAFNERAFRTPFHPVATQEIDVNPLGFS